ncbi:hypothetical protein ACJZ2D_006255 [Fusarium nematophilum]
MIIRTTSFKRGYLELPSTRAKIQGNFSLADVLGVEKVRFPSRGEPLLSVSAQQVGELEIADTEGLKVILLEHLEFVNYTATIHSNRHLDHVSMSLVDAAMPRINRNAWHTHISLPNLERLGGCIPEPDPEFDSIVGGTFRDVFNISMPKMREAHGFDRSRHRKGWGEDDSDENSSGGILDFTSNSFPELSLPRLETVNCTMSIEENALLDSLWIPRLSYVRDLEIRATCTGVG